VTPDDFLQIGYIARAHGLTGEVGVKTFDPASTALEAADVLRLRLKDGAEVDFKVDSIRGADKETLIGFEGIETRTEAEKLAGAVVSISRDALPAPKPGEFFQGDLVGLSAVDETGAVLGIVEEIWNTGPVPNLVIRGEGQPELVLPFVDEFVPSVDLAARKIVVKRPEYFE
jgi:16S rRNA processing protein RimM